jgi:hypothetical protein
MKTGQYIVLFVFLFLIYVIALSLLSYNNKETFDKKITLLEWSWPENEALFQQLFRDVNKDVEVWEKRPDSYALSFTNNDAVIQVQYSPEPYFKEPESFDLNFIPVANESKNVIIFPFASHFLNTTPFIDANKLLTKRSLQTKKETFCLFSVTNGDFKERNDFFTRLSEYKKVDSCGKFMNNMNGGGCPGNWKNEDYLKFIDKYKFMICFESKTMPNYFTEKLINAYYGGAIPIYWGCPNIDDYVNMDAILYLKPNFTDSDVSDLIKQIEHLDMNEDAYKAKYESVFFKNGALPDAFNVESLRQKINDRLLNQ